jgi:hypothetical protein
MIGSAYVDVDGVSGGIDGLSSLSSEFVLSVELLDAGVDLGSPPVVDPPRRNPFRHPVVVDSTRPAFLVGSGCGDIGRAQGQVANTAQNVPSR